MRILLGVPIRQKKEIFEEYLKSLDRLKVPKGYSLDRCFYFHNCPELASMCGEEDTKLFNFTDDEYDTSGKTHIWSDGNLSEVANMKNKMIKKALDEEYDYYFMVDSDLILNPDTLKILIARDKAIVAEVFWTEWSEGTKLLEPNCWDLDAALTVHPEKYFVPALHRCGGTGALILIKREVIEKGVNYSPLYNVSFTKWEDRAFCIRAAAHGYEIYIDTTSPARHLYRHADYERYMRKVNRKK